ncbi:hypothetical protein ABZV24_22490 [Streptomyces sp. NPDC005251]|uniref:hypothetical protein n=1 Tax=Streptomyces sp. NPDC005251 TaxID=3157166 RepID=UPI0033A1284E
MLNLLMTPRTARTVRGLLGTVADAVRSVITPAALIEAQQLETIDTETAPDPAGVYAADELPEVKAIETAAEYAAAADQARTADRAKRKTRKLLDRLPAGLYGGWLVSRTPSSRQTADLDAIRATYERLGLGPVPMKQSAPSLKVERVDVPALAA